MNKLFIFQNGFKEDYYHELECAFDICRSENNTKRADLDELSAEQFIEASVDVVISNRLPIEWYLIFKGLKIATITIDSNEDDRNYSDITIDYKSNNRFKYFTGKSHSICGNRDTAEYYAEIFELITVLDWDTEFFGYPVAYLSSRRLTDSIMYRIEKFIQENSVKLVEYKCDCHDRRSVCIAEKNGYEFKDIRLTYERPMDCKQDIQLGGQHEIRLAQTHDIPELLKIGDKLYQDSRYYFDKNFKMEKVDEFYRSWIEKAVLGTFDHECYTLFEKGKPVAFCTIRYGRSKIAEIGLVGVAKERSGEGLCGQLLQFVINMMMDKKIKKLMVVTQGRNYFAQRLYQKMGFMTYCTELWYHKWI